VKIVVGEFGFLDVNIVVGNVRGKYHYYVEQLVIIKIYVRGIIHKVIIYANHRSFSSGDINTIFNVLHHE